MTLLKYLSHLLNVRFSNLPHVSNFNESNQLSKTVSVLSVNERNVFCMLPVSAECKSAMFDSISMALTLDLFLSEFCIVAILSSLK